MQTVADMRGLGFKYIGKYADILCGLTLMEVNHIVRQAHIAGNLKIQAFHQFRFN